MAANKSVLSDLIKGRVSAQGGQEFKMIPLNQLVENDKNVMFTIIDTELEELINSIQAVGLSEPLTVTPDGDKFRIVSGHRRSRALKKLYQERPTEKDKWGMAPCYVRRYASPEDEELALIMANTQVRKDRSWIVPASNRIRELLTRKMDRDGVKYRGNMQKEIAQALGISRQNLQRQEYIAAHLEPSVNTRWPNMPTQVALEVAHMEPEHQKELAERWPHEDVCITPTLYEIKMYSAAKFYGDDYWKRFEEKKQREEKEREEAERKRKEKEQRAKQLKAERKKRDNDYRTELALKTLGMEVEKTEAPPTPPAKPKAPSINWGYDDKLVMERFKKAREMAKVENPSSTEQTGYGNISDIIEAVKKYHCSADYLLGLTEYPTITPDSSPAPAAPEWKLITADAQPPEGLTVDVVTWMDDRWYRGRMAWHPDYLDSGMVQMWMECIHLPPPPENGGGGKTV